MAKKFNILTPLILIDQMSYPVLKCLPFESTLSSVFVICMFESIIELLLLLLDTHLVHRFC